MAAVLRPSHKYPSKLLSDKFAEEFSTCRTISGIVRLLLATSKIPDFGTQNFSTFFGRIIERI